MQPFPVLIALSLLATALPAQRGKPALDWQKLSTALDYGAVPLGKHGLDELKVGEQWRLGMGDATRWSLQMPAMLGDKALPPGEYRLRLQRLDEKKCVVVVQGSHFVLGGDDLHIAGELGKTSKPVKKLTIGFDKGASKDKVTLPVQLDVQFGETQWKGDLALCGNKTSKVGGYVLTVFTLPAAAVAARDKTPAAVAVLSKGEEHWNVMLGGSDAKLVPWLEIPANNFAELKGPEDGAILTGKLEAADAQADKEVEFVELHGATLQKGEFALQFAAGKQTLAVTLPEPKAKKK